MPKNRSLTISSVEEYEDDSSSEDVEETSSEEEENETQQVEVEDEDSEEEESEEDNSEEEESEESSSEEERVVVSKQKKKKKIESSDEVESSEEEASSSSEEEEEDSSSSEDKQSSSEEEIVQRNKKTTRSKKPKHVRVEVSEDSESSEEDSDVSSLDLGVDDESGSDSDESALSILIDSAPRSGGIKKRQNRGVSYDSDSSSYYDSSSDDEYTRHSFQNRLRNVGAALKSGNVQPAFQLIYDNTTGIRRIMRPVVTQIGSIGVVQKFTRAASAKMDILKADYNTILASKKKRPKNQSIVEWGKGLSAKNKKALARLAGVAFLFFSVFFLPILVSFGQSLRFASWGSGAKRAAPFDPRWKNSRGLNYTDLLDLVHVYQPKQYNDSNFYVVKVKKFPKLDKPQYQMLGSKELVQIKRPAVRKKRPDEPRAVRTFGCLRDGCRGLAIEDLLDRGWQMRFRAAQVNDTYKNINYRVTFLLTDGTQLTHMKKLRPDLYKNIYEDYEGKCYLTAFDGGDAIGGNKGMQIKIKEKFLRKYGCRFNDLAITPSSYRLYLVDECRDLTTIDETGVTWLLKPETGSQGQGITFHTEVKDVMRKVSQFFPCREKEWKPTERYLVQEYIEKPLLLKKSKFDVRVYMLIASGSPYLLFYHTGYLRRALAEYSALSKDRKVYLTNTHFQSKSKGFKLSDHIWPFEMMQDHLRDHGRTGGHYVETMLNPYIKKVLLFIFQSARPKLKKRRGTFHIFGIDFMIDAAWHVWFIEANGYPGYTWSLNFDTRNMVEEQFNLAQQVHENPRFYMLMQPGDRYGDFEMLFNEIDEERTQSMYNPCEEFKYNRGYTAPLKEANRRFAKFSGAGGRTDAIKGYNNLLKGAEFLGGPLHVQLKARGDFFNKHGCDANALRYSPSSFLLHDQKTCENFFNDAGSGSWVLKPVASGGDAKEFEYFQSLDDLKGRSNVATCSDRQPDYVVQQYVPNRILIDNKYWDMKVYLLIASTKPWMVFYHHGFLRSVRLVNPPGVGTTAPEVVETEPPKTDELDLDSMDMDDFDMEGVVQEKWCPKDEELATGATWKLGESFMTFDKFQDYAARNNIVGSRYVSSIFDSYAKRVSHLLFQSARENLVRTNTTYQLVGLNFFLDSKMVIHFAGARNAFPDTIPNVEELQEHKANMLETMAGLVLELHDMPSAFSRMRRGDSYGNWRLVFSEMEEHQRRPKYDPCDEFKRNLMVSKGQLFKNAWLHNYAEKRHAANKRELRKYIDKKWRESCRGKPSKELQASCIRNTISYRYKIYLEKEGVPYQDGFVDMTIRDLQNKAAQAAAGG